MEEVTVQAGVFRCFKVVQYDEDGNPLMTNWISDKVKQWGIKIMDHDTGETQVLMSYSIS